MKQPWDETFNAAPHRGRKMRTVAGLALLSAAALMVYRLDALGRVAYAVELGRLNAQRDYLADVPPDEVAALDRISLAFQHVAEVIKPSVVNIQSTSAGRRRRGDDFFGDDRPRRRTTSAGSGVLFDNNGHIVTSRHVVADASSVNVTLADGREFKADVVGTDRMTDVAVLKINAPRLIPARFGDSDRVQVGHLVMAVGSPFMLEQSVSHGICSAKGRSAVNLDIEYQDFIQTDVPINPGNSGGPLINSRGEVIGINTAIATESGSFAGVAFTTPSNMVSTIARRLMTGKPLERGYLGVEIGVVTAEQLEALKLNEVGGVVIRAVREDGPASEAGLRSDDVVLKVNGRVVKSVPELQQIIANQEPGDKSDFLISRGGKTRTISVKVGRQPENFSTRGGISRPERDNE